MNINITNTRNLSVAEIEAFLLAPKPIKFSATDKKETYKWIETTLVRLEYRKLKRHQKGIVRAYIKVMTGYSKPQVARLIARQRKEGHIVRKDYHRTKFPVIYQREDIVLLAKTDEAHDFISGPAIRKILEREYTVYGKKEYERLSGISSSHIYNLRISEAYRHTTHYCYHHTRPIGATIGERRKPAPDGRPGFIRIDSVHQGDSEEFGKGVYHINFIDEVTQWEMVASVACISERYLMPVLEMILETVPFIVLGFHSDNGSEYINKIVAKLLNKLHIDQTKSRPRKSNDNALIETKNGSIVRKHMGYHFIDKSAAPLINEWYQQYFNVLSSAKSFNN